MVVQSGKRPSVLSTLQQVLFWIRVNRRIQNRTCCNVERTEGRFPNWTTISADGGPVGKTPFCPFHIDFNPFSGETAETAPAVKWAKPGHRSAVGATHTEGQRTHTGNTQTSSLARRRIRNEHGNDSFFLHCRCKRFLDRSSLAHLVTFVIWLGLTRDSLLELTVTCVSGEPAPSNLNSRCVLTLYF